MTDDSARFAPAFDENAHTIATMNVPLTTPKAFTRALIADTAAAHGLTYDDLMARNRTRRVVYARREAIRKVCEARPDWSYPEIGKLFGFHHSTVMFHLRKSGGMAPRLHSRILKKSETQTNEAQNG